jgi:hypothetical protein
VEWRRIPPLGLDDDDHAYPQKLSRRQHRNEQLLERLSSLRSQCVPSTCLGATPHACFSALCPHGEAATTTLNSAAISSDRSDRSLGRSSIAHEHLRTLLIDRTRTQSTNACLVRRASTPAAQELQRPSNSTAAQDQTHVFALAMPAHLQSLVHCVQYATRITPATLKRIAQRCAGLLARQHSVSHRMRHCARRKLLNRAIRPSTVRIHHAKCCIDLQSRVETTGVRCGFDRQIR